MELNKNIGVYMQKEKEKKQPYLTYEFTNHSYSMNTFNGTF